MEQAILTIPEDVAADIQNGSNAPLGRRLLELAAIKALDRRVPARAGPKNLA